MSSAVLRPDAPEFVSPAPALGPAAARLVRRIAISGIPRTGLTLRGAALAGALLLHVLALLWIVHGPAPVDAPQIVMHAALIAPEPLPMTAPTTTSTANTAMIGRRHCATATPWV